MPSPASPWTSSRVTPIERVTREERAGRQPVTRSTMVSPNPFTASKPVATACCACSTTPPATRFTRDAPPRRALVFFAAPDFAVRDRELLPPVPLRELPLELPLRELLLRELPPRFIVLFFAVPRFAVDLFAPPLLVLFFAAPRFAVLFFAPPRFAVLFFPPERLLIAGPRRVLFFPALRFVPRPDFFVAIAASPHRK